MTSHLHLPAVRLHAEHITPTPKSIHKLIAYPLLRNKTLPKSQPTIQLHQPMTTD